MLKSPHEHSNKGHPEAVLLHSGPGDVGHYFISHHGGGSPDTSSKLVFPAFFLSLLEITSLTSGKHMGQDEDGTGDGVVESPRVVSAVAVWRGGWQDKTGCWYLHGGSSWVTQVSV